MASREHARPRPLPQRLILPLALLLAVVGALIVAWGTLADQRVAEPVPSPTPPASGPAATSPTPTRTPNPSASASRSASATPSRSASASASPTPTRSPSPSPTPTANPQSFRVVVFNATTKTGLAARTADQLRGEGWTISSVGNWSERPPSTTVYYPSGAGAEAAARVLAKALGVDRIRAAYDALPANRLVVVLG